MPDIEEVHIIALLLKKLFSLQYNMMNIIVEIWSTVKVSTEDWMKGFVKQNVTDLKI